jgi:rhodanese-related sulfurtransferase/rubrerythrin
MFWKPIHSQVKTMSSKEASEFIASHKEGTYTLLDVRQAWEYEQGHIPGGKLIPLPELLDRLNELNPENPTLLYCATGRRSAVAAQLISEKGFKELFNLQGGMKAWTNKSAIGRESEGVDLLRGDESPEAILMIAYGMEEGLGAFYRLMALETENHDVQEMFKRLAGIEESHIQQLYKLYSRSNPSVADRLTFEQKMISTYMEGGLTPEAFIQSRKPAMESATDIVELALTIEAQALDLYLRYSQKLSDSQAKQIVLEIAESEKLHMKALGRLMDRILQATLTQTAFTDEDES